MQETRRRLIVAGGGAALAAALPRATTAAEPRLETPDMALGPFYPVRKPIEADADLTRLKGHRARAKGEVIEVSGRILAVDGRPQPHAKLEVWQANSFGRYAHVNDHGAARPDPDFQGYADLTADAGGRFRFLTVKPAPYKAGDADFIRAAHIHFDVRGRSRRLITQMYFPADEALLRQDQVLMADMSSYKPPFPSYIFGQLAAERSALGPAAAHYRFDVVLADG